MTNVKLKLMFFLLNALLTADIVNSRPYSDNTTDIVIKFTNNNDTFHLPVESNSDTLVVAIEDVVEETNKNSEAHMEDLLKSEQDRDEEITTNNKKEAISLPELPKEEVVVPEKQSNISNPFWIGETHRDDGLTDVFLRPEADFAEEMPRYEFLIAGKINESESTSKNESAEDSMNVNSLKSTNSSDGLKKVDYVELVEVMKPSGENKSAYNLVNITGHEVDNDLAPDTILSMFSGFTDLQTLFLACFATLVPLLGILCATLLIRCMCRRWCPGVCRKEVEPSVSESTEKRSSDGQLKPTSDDMAADVEGETPSGNGSIITMTLKNNHLIVETEERNDIMRNGRETKMKYSPDNDGIFVVEVQQSAVYRPNKPVQNSPPHDPQISTNQALIHRVPEELELKIPEEDSEKSSGKFDKDNKALALSSTGLSISDLSMSSIGSHNVSYSYGSQVGYEQGPFGYPVYAGYEVPKEDIENGIIHDSSREPLITKTPTDPDKPVVTAAIFKQDSVIGNDITQAPGYCIEGCSDGPLLSDVQAREVILKNIHDQKKLENGVAVPVTEKIESPKQVFNRSDSLPVRLEDDKITEGFADRNINMELETINENADSPSKEMMKGKRASLPIIRTEMYESLKDVIIPTGSPKFAKFNNETSPGESSVDSALPMITITEETELAKLESVS